MTFLFQIWTDSSVVYIFILIKRKQGIHTIHFNSTLYFNARICGDLPSPLLCVHTYQFVSWRNFFGFKLGWKRKKYKQQTSMSTMCLGSERRWAWTTFQRSQRYNLMGANAMVCSGTQTLRLHRTGCEFGNAETIGRRIQRGKKKTLSITKYNNAGISTTKSTDKTFFK